MAKTCKHNWAYEHMVYQGRGRSSGSVGVHRQCRECGKDEMAFTDKWEAKPQSYCVADLREKAVPHAAP